ncbi:hypothetical protein GCM10020256_12540 [Streptomyces thermocoprophilus]
MDISAATALVTGANRGLGRALAQELTARGATVYAAARRPEQVDLPGVKAIQLDVTDPASVAAAAEAAGDVNLLINNAGTSTGADLLTGEWDDLRLELDTHYLGSLRVIRAFAAVIEARGGGAVLNILSVLSWIGLPSVGAYAAAKSAAWSMTNTVRQQLAPPRHHRVGTARGLHGHRHGPPRHPAEDRPGGRRACRRRRHRLGHVRDRRGRPQPQGAGGPGRRCRRRVPAVRLIEEDETPVTSSTPPPAAIRDTDRRPKPGGGRPGGGQPSRFTAGVTLVAMCLGAMTTFLLITASVSALTAIQDDLRVSPTGLVWIPSAYTLLVACLVMSAGTVGNIHGRKRAFLTGTTVMIIGSLTVYTASSTTGVITGQLISGVGGALILPNSLALLGAAFPDPPTDVPKW